MPIRYNIGVFLYSSLTLNLIFSILRRTTKNFNPPQLGNLTIRENGKPRLRLVKVEGGLRNVNEELVTACLSKFEKLWKMDWTFNKPLGCWVQWATLVAPCGRRVQGQPRSAHASNHQVRTKLPLHELWIHPNNYLCQSL